MFQTTNQYHVGLCCHISLRSTMAKSPGDQRADLGRLQRMEDLGVQVGVDRLSVAVEVENQRPLAFEHSLNN